jgi:DNA-binding protein HU-beta
MRQKELVELAMQTMNVSRDQATKALAGVFETLARALKEGDGKVPMEGVGTFRIKTTKARRFTNPFTKVPVDVPERKKVTFKAATELVVALNGSPDSEDDDEND